MSQARRDVARMVGSYARPVLEGWARARGLDPQKMRVPELQQELARVLLAPAALKAALNGATADELATLARLKEAGGKFSAAELKAQLVVDGVNDPDAVYTALMARGLLFYDRSLEGYYGRWELWGGAQHPFTPPLWLPPELEELVQIPEGLGNLPLERASEPSRAREGSFAALQRDVYLLLQALRESPVKLLKSGGVSKRDSQRLLQIVPPTGIGEDDPTATARQQGSWFHFLFFLLQQAELLRPEPGQLIVSPAGLQFLSLDEGQQALRLVRAWANLPDWSEFLRVPTLEFELPGYRALPLHGPMPVDFQGIAFGDLPSSPQLIMARLTLMELFLRQRPYPGWYSFSSLLASMKRLRVNFLIPRTDMMAFMPMGGRLQQKENRQYRGFHAKESKPRRHFDKDRDWDEVEGAFLRLLLEEPLLWLGIVRLGYEGEELVSFELTERGAVAIGVVEAPVARPAGAAQRDEMSRPGERALVVQPNFEVVVYPEVAGIPLLVQLDRFAQRVGMDRAALYRLTRADLCRGLQEGLALAEITRVLETGNGGPLPQNVAYSLEEWERLFNRIHVRRVATLIEAADDAELAALRALPALREAREVAPRVLLVPPDISTRYLRPEPERINYTAPVVDAVEFETATRIRVFPGALSPRLRHRLLQIADPVEAPDRPGDSEARSGTRRKGAKKAKGEAAATIISTASDSSVLPSLQGDAAAFVLNREKVARTARWWKWEAMHQFLVSAAKAKPPAELEVVLKGWAGGLAPAALTGVTLLAAPGADWLDEVLRVPEVKPLVLHRLSPTLALVSEENRPRLEAALATLGVSTGAEGSLGSLISAAAQADAEAGELLLIGPPRKRRALIERAIAERRKLMLAQMPYSGKLTPMRIDPVRIEGEGQSAYLVARVEGLRYEQQYPLNRIQGVRMLDEPSKS